MRKLALGLLLIAMPGAALAQARAMTLAEFLARAAPIEKKGILGMMSSDARKLGQELVKVAEATRAEQDQAQRAGRKPATCLPPKGKAKVNGRELMAYLRALPTAQRNMSLQAAFRGFVAKRYPCSA